MWDHYMSNMSPLKNAHEALKGFVSLIGAGPGHPQLITRLGYERLTACDVIVHDRLIPCELLLDARAGCELVDVGKIPGQTRIPQDFINTILIEKASRGLHVVRLKGGDPSIFGRVGEEASALAEAGIPFEIIPGVTAASGAAAAAGIPLTQRGLSSCVSLITVHEDPGKGGIGLDWRVLAQSGSLALYMAGGKTREVGQGLIEAGLPPATPVILVQNATLPDEKKWIGSLLQLSEGHILPAPGAPFIVLVGSVAGLALPDLKRQPLSGKSVVLTGPLSSEKEGLPGMLRLYGAEILFCPSIEIVPPEDARPLEEAIRNLNLYDWILFTSRNTVDFFFECLRGLGFDARKIGHCRIASVGVTTSKHLMKQGIRPDLVPAVESTGACLARELIAGETVRDRRFLFPCSEIAGVDMSDLLTQAGAQVDRLTAYRTITRRSDWPCRRRLIESGCDGLSFASPSAVDGFWEILGADHASRICRAGQVFSIGPTTTRSLAEHGVEKVHQAPRSSPEGMLSIILETLASPS